MWSAAELEAILDAIPARVSWWDTRLRLCYTNAAAIAAFGEQRAGVLGRSVEDLLGAEWVRANAGYLC